MPPRSTAASAAAHAVLLLALLATWHRAPQPAPYKLPGTAHGLTQLTYFAPGSPPHPSVPLQTLSSRPKAALSAAAVERPAVAPATKLTAPPDSQPGTGTSADSGLGDGNIRIALQKVFPYPRPDLSTLPHGTKGDVILDAVVDEHGNITTLTLLHGLGPAIDDAVIATVRTWTYTPATRNGTPIPSEQELHFHYERS